MDADQENQKERSQKIVHLIGEQKISEQIQAIVCITVVPISEN